jgi:uncharacterized protein YkwD
MKHFKPIAIMTSLSLATILMASLVYWQDYTPIQTVAGQSIPTNQRSTLTQPIFGPEMPVGIVPPNPETPNPEAAAATPQPTPNIPTPAMTRTTSVSRAVTTTAPRPAAPAKAAPTPAPAPAPAVAQPASCGGGFTQQFFCLLNQYRASKGLGKISQSAGLAGVAITYSQWMNSTSTFSHVGPNGERLSDRCAAAGITCRAENLAKGATSAQNLLDMWKASASHNAILLGGYSVGGLGTSGMYTTLLMN